MIRLEIGLRTPRSSVSKTFLSMFASSKMARVALTIRTIQMHHTLQTFRTIQVHQTLQLIV